MPCKSINNNSNLEVEKYKPLFDNFFPYTQKTLGYDRPFALNFMSDQENYQNPLGKTAYYDPSSHEITIYTDGRHIKDILRSISHELVHHAQNCRGEFDGGLETGPGYAQKDDKLRNMEKEAYLQGNLLFRDWEDNYKQIFMENREMKKLRTMVRKILKEELAKSEIVAEQFTAGLGTKPKGGWKQAADKIKQDLAARDKQAAWDAKRQAAMADAGAMARSAADQQSTGAFTAGLTTKPKGGWKQAADKIKRQMAYRDKHGAGATPLPPEETPRHDYEKKAVAQPGPEGAGPKLTGKSRFHGKAPSMTGAELFGKQARDPSAVYTKKGNKYFINGKPASPRQARQISNKWDPTVREEKSLTPHQKRHMKLFERLSKLYVK
jgi:hypothetical protein